MRLMNQTILGTRIWSVETTKGKGYLLPPYYPEKGPWTQNPYSAFIEPRADNDSGLYANNFSEESIVHKLYATRSWNLPTREYVFGLVVGSGKTFIHTSGFRSQHMQIVALFTPKGLNLNLNERVYKNCLIFDNQKEFLKFTSYFVNKHQGSFYDLSVSDSFVKDFQQWKQKTLREIHRRSTSVWANGMSPTKYGMRVCRKNGLIHRQKGPAVIRKDGRKEWWRNRKKHRANKLPAVLYEQENRLELREYWEDGKFLRKEIEDCRERKALSNVQILKDKLNSKISS